MSDRKIEHLSPRMQDIWVPCAAEIEAEGIDLLVTCTKRTQEEQEGLWARGRSIPGPKVTWTMHSKHLTGDAVDFVVMVGGKPDWRMAHRELWDKVVAIGKRYGLSQVIGKNGKVKEFAHLQIG